MNKVFTK